MKDIKQDVEPKEVKKNDKKEKEDKEKENEMSEEDKQLLEELDMLVNRLKENDTALYLPALESLRSQIRSATTSMTSVPKPLKFLREHYDTLKQIYEVMPTEETQRFLADIISILAMTMPPEKHGVGEALR